jgi:single-stranded DNA-binding protein
LTLEVLDRSENVADYHYQTPVFFRHLTDKDDDQKITLVTSSALPQHCRLVNVTGVLRSTGFVDSVQFIAEDYYPILVTPNWPGNKWANLEGIRKRQADITIIGDNLGQSNNFRSGQTATGTPVFNCSIASRRPQEILAGDLNAAPTWFDLSLWGKLGENYGPRLSGGQSVQYCYGKLSFRHWGNHGDRVSLQVSVRTFLPGRSNAMPNPDAQYSEAPPADADPEADAQLEEQPDLDTQAEAGAHAGETSDSQPLEDYADIPM